MRGRMQVTAALVAMVAGHAAPGLTGFEARPLEPSFLGTDNEYRIPAVADGLYPISRFISRTAASRPVKRARAMMACPMLSSSISGTAHTGPTFL